MADAEAKAKAEKLAAAKKRVSTKSSLVIRLNLDHFSNSTREHRSKH
jgi:hypothetical protein